MGPRALLAVPSAGLLGWFTLRRCLYLAAGLAPPPRIRPLPDDKLPSVSLIVPARDEEQVAGRVLVALDNLDYPRDRLAIVLVDHGSCDGTGRLFREWADGRPNAAVISLGRSGGKGTALNAALRATDGELVGVIDADLRPWPDALRRLAEVFAEPGVGAAAALVAPVNADASFVSRYAAVDAWVHQLITSAAKDRLGLDPPTFGASLYLRVALERVGGFPDDGFHEDLAAGLAIASRGHRTRFVGHAVVDNWVVEDLGAYWRQHVRWTRGPFDVAAAGRPAGSLLRRLETRTVHLGYGDRLVFLAAVFLAVARVLPRWLPAVYLAVQALEVGVALSKAAPTRRLPGFLASTVLFPLDVSASLVAVAFHIARRPRRWDGRGATARHGEPRSRGRRPLSARPITRPAS